MATWKKVIVSGSNISQLNNDAGYVASIGGGLVSSSAQIDINATDGIPLLVENGGTGATTFASGEVLIGNTQGAIQTKAIGIANDNIVEIDSTTVADNEYARFTANGLESRTAAEVFTDITAGTGTISGSAQLNLADLTDGNGIVDFTYDGSSTAVITLDTASAHFTNGVVDALPAGTVSGSEQIEDVVGGMVTGNTETGISVTYQDGDGTLDFAVAYGSTANTAVQGNTQATIAVTANELTLDAGTSAQALGGGPSWTLGLADSIAGDRTFQDDVIISGDLTVNGTTTSVNTTNLQVEDRFILLNSGSSTGDGGIIVQTETNFSGQSLGWDDSAGRWGLEALMPENDTAITPLNYLVSVSQSANPPVDLDGSDYGGTGTGYGNMHITTAGDIYIFS